MDRRILNGVARGAPLTIEVNGAAVPAFAGETIAAALLAAGVRAFRTDAAGRAHAPYCNMGVCFECVVRDGATGAALRACMEPVRPGLRILIGDKF